MLCVWVPDETTSNDDANDGDEGLWAAAGDEKYRCSDTGSWKSVAGQAECQQEAIDHGYSFYSYRPSNFKCYISATCDAPTPTSADWQIFSNGTLLALN
jgi:hypothetical protein